MAGLPQRFQALESENDSDSIGADQELLAPGKTPSNSQKNPPAPDNHLNPYVRSQNEYVEKVKSAIRKSYSTLEAEESPGCMIQTFVTEMDISITSLREQLRRTVIRVTGDPKTGKTSLCAWIPRALKATWQGKRSNKQQRFHRFVTTDSVKPQLHVIHYAVEQSVKAGKIDWWALWQSYHAVAGGINQADGKYNNGIMLLDGHELLWQKPPAEIGDIRRMTPTTSVHMCKKESIDDTITADLFLQPNSSNKETERNVFKVLVYQLMKESIQKTELRQLLDFTPSVPLADHAHMSVLEVQAAQDRQKKAMKEAIQRAERAVQEEYTTDSEDSWETCMDVAREAFVLQP